MSDLTLICRDCHNEFVWSEDEQMFYREKNLAKPVYCRICRSRNAARERQFAKYRKT